MNEPRRYQSTSDLTSMLDLLMAGRKADNGSYYVHCGDLKWWLYYPPLEGDLWTDISLWDDPVNPGRLLGWALLSREWDAYDVYVQPELRGSSAAQSMYCWAESKAVETARQNERKKLNVLWVRNDDAILAEHFGSMGYRLGVGMLHLTRRLDDFAGVNQAIDGFTVRSCKGLPEVTQRAQAQYGAFAVRAEFEPYVKRFERLMASPVYDNSCDIVAAAPDGRIAAFCITWMDQLNRVGLFEPVGTHPDFQRKGLGKAVMVEGLRRMKDCGMQQAIITTDEGNLAAIKLYESLGFQVVFKLGTFEKDV